MEFGDILSKSWKEYKSNFKVIFLIMFLFVGIPSLIVFAVNYGMLSSNEELLNSVLVHSQSGGDVGSEFLKFWPYYITLGVLFFIYILISLFASVSFISVMMRKSRFSYREAIGSGKEFYWRYLLFMLVFLLFLGALFFALFIPGIIFLVYWIFAVFIYYEKKGGIISSLGESFRLVRGRWWGTFGYLLLFGLITIGVYIVAIILSVPTGILIGVISLSGSVPFGLYLFDGFIGIVAQFFSGLIITPLATLFLKNYYFEMKRSKR